jgi:hypothetical protein
MGWVSVKAEKFSGFFLFYVELLTESIWLMVIGKNAGEKPRSVP